MKKNKFKNFLIFSLLFSFISCNTSKVYVDVLKPPSINLGIEYDTILVFNRTKIKTPKEGKQFIYKLFFAKNFKRDITASEICIDAFINSVNDSGKKNAIKIFNENISASDGFFIPLELEKNEIDLLSSNHNNNILVSLDMYKSGYVKEYINEETYEYITISTTWRTYNISDYTVIDQFTNEYCFETKYIKPNNRFKGCFKLFFAVSEIVGYDYASRISPTWFTEPRYIYKTYDKNLIVASKFAQQNHWDEAAEIWLKLSESENEKHSSFSLFNLAVYNEIKGNIDLSIDYVKKAYKIYPTKIMYDYLIILQKRKEEIQILD
ncbi:MAG TPA: DUF6340 family protein [Bacteroidales bacterium]|nr:DUF6340 family protein [Bacteroidales bacterium]HOM36075.1 DUF6340 family protein [Bacteroidales bacterium]HPD22910.1 DUF6340 family protein [Bacteroidales bacterium]HRS98578.1 DUF6340 family protein [Bacteroidales bacterium]HRT79645.1 DUF6340 family protein [Bacteroidales bacterium]